MYMCRFDRLTGGLDIVAADQFFLSHCHSGNYHLLSVASGQFLGSGLDPDSIGQRIRIRASRNCPLVKDKMKSLV
jgi:hypothetical protein